MARSLFPDLTLAAAAVLALCPAGDARAVEPAALLALSSKSPAPPWPAGDELGMANTLGEATTMRCGWHLSQRGARTYEASFVRSNTMPKSPFANPSLSKPKPTAGVPFSAHAFNSEAFDAGAEPQQQGTQIDALGHFASIASPWDPKNPFSADGASYYGGYKQKDVKPERRFAAAEAGHREDPAAGDDGGAPRREEPCRQGPGDGRRRSGHRRAYRGHAEGAGAGQARHPARRHGLDLHRLERAVEGRRRRRPLLRHGAGTFGRRRQVAVDEADRRRRPRRALHRRGARRHAAGQGAAGERHRGRAAVLDPPLHAVGVRDSSPREPEPCRHGEATASGPRARWPCLRATRVPRAR